MQTIQEILKSIEERLKKVKLPFTGTENHPFYVQLEKPRPSMSKHDGKRPDFWDIDDGHYILQVANEMPKILEYIRYLEDQIDSRKMKYEFCNIHCCSSQTCMIVGRSCNSWRLGE